MRGEEREIAVRTKVRWVKINITLIRLGVINPRRERIPMSDQNPSFASLGNRLEHPSTRGAPFSRKASRAGSSPVEVERDRCQLPAL